MERRTPTAVSPLVLLERSDVGIPQLDIAAGWTGGGGAQPALLETVCQALAGGRACCGGGN